MVHRNVETQRRYKKISTENTHYYGFNPFWDEVRGRYYRPTNWRTRYKKFLKRKSNRQVRRYKGVLKNGGQYRKVYDYWWDLF